MRQGSPRWGKGSAECLIPQPGAAGSHMDKAGEAEKANNTLHFSGHESTLQNLLKFLHTPEGISLISQLFCR